MDPRDYCAQVLGALRRATQAEKEAIRAELEDHMEDHACALEEMGWPPEEARVRSAEAMGDPVEMARELDRQYPPLWLFLRRAAVTVTGLLCVLMLLHMGILGMLADSIAVRIHPTPLEPREPEAFTACVELDQRFEIGNDVARVTRLLQGPESASVDLCLYDRRPFGVITFLHGITVSALRDGQITQQGRGWSSKGNWYVHRYQFRVPLSPGDDALLVQSTRFGETVSLTIPLPEEVHP